MKTTEIRRLRRAIRSFHRLTSLQIKRCCTDVTVAQCHVLLEMEAQTETTTQRLAHELRLDKSTVSLTIDTLVKQGMVNRLPDRGDRRVTRLKLTKNGQTTCNELNKASDEYIRRIFERIPRERRQPVIDDFARLAEAIARYEENEA